MASTGYWRQIETDLDWRQLELTSLKLLVVRSNDPTKKALLRSLLAMLYAHYQGFCINALVVYSKAICALGEPVKKHNDPIAITSLRSLFKDVKMMSDQELFTFVNHGFLAAMEHSVQISQVEFDTSNLYPNVLEELCAKVDLYCPEIANNRTLVKSLVGRRNDIAHGKGSDVKDLAEYNKYENAAINVMYSLALTIEEAITRKSYLKEV